MGNIISDIIIDEQIKSNIKNIQCKYELRGIIELYFASIIKNGNWDRFVIKCCKQIDPIWEPYNNAPQGTFKLMCMNAINKNNTQKNNTQKNNTQNNDVKNNNIQNTIKNIMDNFPIFINIKPINRPYALDCSYIELDFPDGFDPSAFISELPTNDLITIREIYAENIKELRVDQFKYDSSDTDSNILQNILLISCDLRVSDALQLVNNIPIHGVYRRLI
jgi:hypothetical protein